MTTMKIRINSPEHSAEVQKKLFSLGCIWGGNPYPGVEHVRFTNATKLYVTRGLIQTGFETDKSFDSEPAPEFVLIDGKLKLAGGA